MVWIPAHCDTCRWAINRRVIKPISSEILPPARSLPVNPIKYGQYMRRRRRCHRNAGVTFGHGPGVRSRAAGGTAHAAVPERPDEDPPPVTSRLTAIAHRRREPAFLRSRPVGTARSPAAELSGRRSVSWSSPARPDGPAPWRPPPRRIHSAWVIPHPRWSSAAGRITMSTPGATGSRDRKPGNAFRSGNVGPCRELRAIRRGRAVAGAEVTPTFEYCGH